MALSHSAVGWSAVCDCGISWSYLLLVRPTGGLTVGVILLLYSLVCTFESISLLYLFLYLDLYVLGDDALISKGSFMQTKHLCVLIHVRIKGEISTVKHV